MTDRSKRTPMKPRPKRPAKVRTLLHDALGISPDRALRARLKWGDGGDDAPRRGPAVESARRRLYLLLQLLRRGYDRPLAVPRSREILDLEKLGFAECDPTSSSWRITSFGEEVIFALFRPEHVTAARQKVSGAPRKKGRTYARER